MSNTDERMKEHGYYEVYVPVWNPETEEQPVNLTLDIYGDEDALEEIGIADAVVTYGASESTMSEAERIIGNNVRTLLRRGLVMDAMCKDHGISSPDDLASRLDDDDFGIYPL